MTALLLATSGILLLAVSVLLLRRTGNAWRVGRLLAAAPSLELEEVIAAARAGARLYVRTHGRISSDEEFPDENQRPLVYRRRRLQVADARGRWRTVDEERLAVPFGLESRDAFLAIDVDALGDGLVAVPRETQGRLSELPADALRDGTAELPADTPVRLRIEQVSAVEHASAAGLTTLLADDRPALTAGAGRPLILTSLEPDAAMRILASGRRVSLVAATVALAAGGLSLVLAAGVALLGL